MLKSSKDEDGLSVDPTLYKSMIDVSYVLLLVAQIFVIVLVCVQDINLILKNHILLLLRGLLDMLVVLLIMVFGILRILM